MWAAVNAINTTFSGVDAILVAMQGPAKIEIASPWTRVKIEDGSVVISRDQVSVFLWLLTIVRCVMSHCWDCFQKAHCSLRGRSNGPCKYYIGPATIQTLRWWPELANQLPRPWHLRPGAAAKARETETWRG